MLHINACHTASNSRDADAAVGRSTPKNEDRQHERSASLGPRAAASTASLAHLVHEKVLLGLASTVHGRGGDEAKPLRQQRESIV